MAKGLRRIKAGHYETADGAFEIIKDPTSGNARGGWGYTSWLVYRKGENEPATRALPSGWSGVDTKRPSLRSRLR